MIRKFLIAALAALALAAPAQAQSPKIVIGMPGIPPIFISTVAYVAQAQDYFKQYGANVELRNFDNGTAASRAVLAGDIDASFSGTAVVIGQVANAGVLLVGVYGFPRQDMSLATTDAAHATCADVKGKQISIDTPGGVRSIALKGLLGAGCHLTLDDVQQVAMGSNTASAMASGQLVYGIVHLDDIPDIELMGHKTITVIKSQMEVSPDNHNLLLVVRRDNLAKKRDAFVRIDAALTAAARFMSDPKNNDRATAIIAPVTGRDPKIASPALAKYVQFGLWATQGDGMNKAQIEKYIGVMAKTGNIQEGKTPPTFDQLIDASVWRDADALMKKTK
ncbi:MAG TPA: ABC transporter substrate-binding protein [Stellaceae bacterium]|nr:ABC transporter substrate-binding protein [Stellaceae bacterium]